MKIGMLSHCYLPHLGGIEIVVQALARELAARHEVVVVSSGYQGKVGRAREDGFVVHRLPAVHATEERLGVPYPLPWGPGVARAVADLWDADVLHCHGALYPGSMLAAALARTRRTPLVLTEHVGFVTYGSRWLNSVETAAWALVGQGVLRSAAAVTTVNERVSKWLAARCDKPVRQIPNGVDLQMFRPLAAPERAAARAGLGLPPGRKLVLFAGRSSEKKNLAPILKLDRAGFDLVVCGARRQLSEPGLVDLGLVPRERMPLLLAAVDAMVHAGEGEGFPLVVQEAMASGLPVVLLWDPGYAHAISRGLVAACADLTEVGATLAALLDDPAARARLAAAGRSWAEQRWSWAASAAQYEALFHGVRPS